MCVQYKCLFRAVFFNFFIIILSISYAPIQVLTAICSELHIENRKIIKDV